MRTFIFLFLISLHLSASTIFETQIHDIDHGDLGEETYVYLSNGQVVKLRTPDGKMLDELTAGRINRAWYRVVIDENRFIETISFLEDAAETKLTSDKALFHEDVNYNPSIIDSLEAAKKIFKDSQYNPKESQCYNRAHVWAYEWRKKHNLYTSKAWLFFSRKYIRKYKFEWWFHVAPMLHVVEDGVVKEKVADIKYAKVPMKLKQWTDIFLRNDADCPVVNTYSDQANYPESAWCFVMKSSMYYYQPIDLELQEKTGVIRDRWYEQDLKNAYLEAFDIAL